MNAELETVKISELPNLGGTQLEPTDVVAGVVSGKTVKVPVERIAKLVPPTDTIDANEFNNLWDAAP